MATDGYITLDVDTEPDDLEQIAFDYLQGVIPGWTPAEGNIEVWLIAAVARIASIVRDGVGNVPVEVFRYFGQLVGLPPEEDVAASAVVTITAVDNAGYTIPADTQIGLRDTTGTLWAFTTVDEQTIAALSTSIAGVEVVAVVAGAAQMDPIVVDVAMRPGQFPVRVRYAHRKASDAGFRFRVLGGDVSVCYPEFPEAE